MRMCPGNFFSKRRGQEGTGGDRWGQVGIRREVCVWVSGIQSRMSPKEWALERRRNAEGRWLSGQGEWTKSGLSRWVWVGERAPQKGMRMLGMGEDTGSIQP